MSWYVHVHIFKLLWTYLSENKYGMTCASMWVCVFIYKWILYYICVCVWLFQCESVIECIGIWVWVFLLNLFFYPLCYCHSVVGLKMWPQILKCIKLLSESTVYVYYSPTVPSCLSPGLELSQSAVCITSYWCYGNMHDPYDSACWLYFRLTAQKLSCRDKWVISSTMLQEASAIGHKYLNDSYVRGKPTVNKNLRSAI